MSRPLPALLLALGSVAFAQNPPVPLPGAGTPAPQTLPGAKIKLQYPNSDVRSVLEVYGRLTNKKLVVDNQVQGTVSIFVAGDVSQEEAIRIIEINLLLNGYTLIPVEHSDIVKVVGNGKNPRASAIPIISDELLLPEGEQVVTYLAKLRYADPVELQQMLSTYIVQAPGNFTNVTALPKSQAILITENTATIRGVLRVIREIDVPPAEVVSEFIQLERADASDVLEKLTGIFEKQPTQAAAPGRPAQRIPALGTPVPGATAEVTAPGTLEINGGTLTEDSIIVGKIKLTADVRTNRIHVVTRPVNIPFVRKLITEFDSTASFGEPVSRPLKFVSVGDVLDVVVKAISEPGAKQEGGGGSAAPGQTTAGRGLGAGNTGFGANGGADGGGGGGGTGFDVSEGLSTDAVDTKPEARIIGTTKIIADKNANAIIVIGGADVRTKVFRLLDYLDQRIPQVMLHTVIGELSLGEHEEFGVDYILRNSGLGLSPIVVGNTGTTTTTPSTGTGAAAGGTGNAGTGTGTTTTTGSGSATDFVSLSGGQPALNLNNLLNQTDVRSIATAGSGGLTGFIAAGNSLTAIVNALENSNRFRVVQRPSVFTRNNKKAIIASGQEIAVPTSSLSSVNGVNNNGFAQQTQVSFKRIALQLEVVPLINSDREVSLDVLQKVDEVSGTTRIDNNDIPNIATRYVKTSVTVPNEGTLVLGGLIRQSQTRTRAGIPLLSNIPLLGYLFGSNVKDKSRTELVILIRPVVSWAPLESLQLRERAQEFLNIDPDLEASLFPTVSRQKADSEPLVRKAIPITPKNARKAPAFRR